MMRRVTHLGGARATLGAGCALLLWDRQLGAAALLANAGSHVVVQLLHATMPPPNAPLHRILVVDDEPDITALVAYHLAKAGYRVITATNGKDALQTAREERPDLVVLDLMLPDVSGYDVLAELRRRDETREIGILLLTARHKEVDRVRGLTLGADDYLLKPFTRPELVLRVGAILRRLRE